MEAGKLIDFKNVVIERYVLINIQLYMVKMIMICFEFHDIIFAVDAIDSMSKFGLFNGMASIWLQTITLQQCNDGNDPRHYMGVTSGRFY